MGAWTRIRNILGLLALGASAALASPGVEVVRAEAEGQVARTAPALQCSDSAAVPVDPQVAAFLDGLRRAARARDVSADEDVVVLNNRGYNYGPPPGIELDAIRAELSGR